MYFNSNSYFKGMPEYIQHQRDAALKLADYRAKAETMPPARDKSKKEKEIQQTPEKRVLLL